MNPPRPNAGPKHRDQPREGGRLLQQAAALSCYRIGRGAGQVPDLPEVCPVRGGSSPLQRGQHLIFPLSGFSVLGHLNAMRTLERYQQKIDALQERCPVRAAIDVIRGRWKPSILFELHSGPKRFSDLRAALHGITPQALSLQLRQLEADGVVARSVFADEVPVRVEYSLTKDGHALSGVMDQLEQWGADYMARRPDRKSRAA